MSTDRLTVQSRVNPEISMVVAEQHGHVVLEFYGGADYAFKIKDEDLRHLADIFVTLTEEKLDEREKALRELEDA